MPCISQENLRILQINYTYVPISLLRKISGQMQTGDINIMLTRKTETMNESGEHRITKDNISKLLSNFCRQYTSMLLALLRFDNMTQKK